MPKYVMIDPQTMKVTQIPYHDWPIMLEVKEADTRVLGCTYNPKKNIFTGYRAYMSTDKSHIIADGKDAAKITVAIKTWDEKPADDVFKEPLMLVIDNIPRYIKKKDEKYELTYQTEKAGMKQICIVDEKLVEQSAISILAIDSE